MMTVLDGVLMELQDCALPLLRGDKKIQFVLCLQMLRFEIYRQMRDTLLPDLTALFSVVAIYVRAKEDHFAIL